MSQCLDEEKVIEEVSFYEESENSEKKLAKNETTEEVDSSQNEERLNNTSDLTQELNDTIQNNESENNISSSQSELLVPTWSHELSIKRRPDVIYYDQNDYSDDDTTPIRLKKRLASHKYLVSLIPTLEEEEEELQDQLVPAFWDIED